MGVGNSLTLQVLIVCRNRRDITLEAIERVLSQPAALAGDLQTKISVFDDASSDGTSQAIATRFPDVRIIHGDGKAFWNGGMHRLWSAVRGAPADAFLWLNDDTSLDLDALERLALTWREVTAGSDGRAILVGATRDAAGTLSYGGFRLRRTPLALRLAPEPPDTERVKPIDTFNGNVVLVGRAVVDEIGLNDPSFFHNLGDVDYGLRARRAGIPVLLLPGTLGVCEGNDAKRKHGYGSPRLSVFEQWRKVNTHHGLPFASWWRFTRRHSGSYWPLHFLLPYRHLLNLTRLRSSVRR